MTDPAPVTFRPPLTALLGVFGLIVCVTPVAFALPGLQVLYLIPLAIAVWVVRTRTVVGPETVLAQRIWGSRQLAWSELAGVRIDGRSRVWAVLHGGEEVALPTLQARDLPVLAAWSGGRLPDPLGGADSEPAAEGQQGPPPAVA
ncbi:MAG TPA: PH domain-containing protein [Pseudonocardiaceae bacterium]